MNNYLIKLRQNIFQITLVSASVFGLSLAYLMNKSIIFFLKEPLLKSKGSASLLQRQDNSENIPDRDQVVSLAAANLLRGTVTSLDGEQKAGQFSIEGLTLIGIIAGSPRYARASIQIKGEQSANAYAIGDEINNGKIVAIDDILVTFEDTNGSRSTLSLEDNLKGSGIQEENVSLSAQTSSKAKKVERIVLNRDRFKQLIKDQAELFRLKFAPSIKGTKVNGWRLIKVPSDHFLYSMGARSGDIIRRYNGQELENQERMISMWQSLQTANQVSVDIDRGGTLINYDISIK